MNSTTAIGSVLAFLGPIFGFLFPLILIGLGVLGIKNRRKRIGGNRAKHRENDRASGTNDVIETKRYKEAEAIR